MTSVVRKLIIPHKDKSADFTQTYRRNCCSPAKLLELMPTRLKGPVPSSLITQDHVEGLSDTHLYCMVHRTFESMSQFSGGSTGQQRLKERYCLAATAAERAAMRKGELGNKKPTDEGLLEGARLCGYSGLTDLRPAPTAASRRDERMAARPAPAAGAVQQAAGQSRRVAAPVRPRIRRTRVTAQSAAAIKAQKRKAARGKPTHTTMAEGKRLYDMWSSGRDVTFVRWTNPHRGGAYFGAVDIPPCASAVQMLNYLERLRLDGILREAKPRKLHLTLGAVKMVTSASVVVPSGAMICGQAALVSAFGHSLEVLGVEWYHPSPDPGNNLLTCLLAHSLTYLLTYLQSRPVNGRYACLLTY